LHDLIVRTLSREYRLRSSSAAAIEAFAFVEAAPRMPGPPEETIVLPLDQVGDFYRLRLPNGLVQEGSPQHLIGELSVALGGSIESECAGRPMLHAATAHWNRVRSVFLGRGGYGKTTLMLRLLQEGFVVEGDEIVVVGPDAAQAVPRRLRVKEGSLSVVPELAALIRAAPSLPDWDHRLIYSMVPDIRGEGWTAGASKVGNLVFIEPNHGGSSVLSVMRPDEAFDRLVAEAVMPAAGKARAAAWLRLVAQRASCWRLQLGGLDRAVSRLKRCLG
jgi:hypothetical protein